MKRVYIIGALIFLVLVCGLCSTYLFKDKLKVATTKIFQNKANLFPFKVDDNWGFIDSKGAIIVPPQYEDVHYPWYYNVCSEGLCAVKVKEKWGAIDLTGKMKINPQFDGLGPFNSGLAEGIIGGKLGYIDKKGKYVINPQFELELRDDDIQDIWKQNAFNEKLKEYPFYAYSFKFGGSFKEGLARVNIGNHFGYIDKTGKYVINPQFDFAGQFSEGLANVVFGGKAGYIDKKGKYVINPQFDAASEFHDGLAQIVIGNKMGYIDKKGIISINPQFDDAKIFTKDGLAAVMVNDKWGFINKTGAFVINPQYEYAIGFQEGLAAVMVNNKWGFINTKGDTVIKPQFDSVGVSGFTQGICWVEIDGVHAYIDKNGKYIFKVGDEARLSAKKIAEQIDANKSQWERIEDARERIGAAKGVLSAIRSALQVFYGDNEGIFPSKIEELTKDGKYLNEIPYIHLPGHPRTNAVKYINSGEVPYKNFSDSGGYIYHSSSKYPNTWGDIYLDCTHKHPESNKYFYEY
ncbi:MAG: WG repeat-containing protein [Elusimicrobia bacterium]|nr:WG repeat-containing protein [Elusimicrobiota bacterium]